MGRLTQSWKAAFIFGMLLFGSYNTLNLKWQFETCVPELSAPTLQQESPSDGCPAGQKLFNKPWAQNWFMFWGEFGLLPLAQVQQSRRDARRMAKGKLPKAPDKAPFYIFAIPSFCDVLGSGLGGLAMMFVSASVWQMMRGSIVIFTSALTVLWLKKKLMKFHWFGISFTMLGLVCVAYAAIADASGSEGAGNRPGFGIMLVLIAQLTASFQGVFEEHLLQGMNIAATKTVGFEGFWGVLLQSVLCLAFTLAPGADHGKIEYMPESVTMYEGSLPIQLFTLKYMISIAMYNLCGLSVTKSISAITRCLVDSCRTMVVWLVSLAFFYGFEGRFRAYGSPWTEHSWLQACGFLLLIIGTLIYNAVLKIPGLRYDQSRQDEPPQAIWSPHAPQNKGLNDYELSPPASPNYFSPADSPHGSTASAEPLLEKEQRAENETIEF